MDTKQIERELTWLKANENQDAVWMKYRNTLLELKTASHHIDILVDCIEGVKATDCDNCIALERGKCDS